MSRAEPKELLTRMEQLDGKGREETARLYLQNAVSAGVLERRFVNNFIPGRFILHVSSRPFLVRQRSIRSQQLFRFRGSTHAGHAWKCPGRPVTGEADIKPQDLAKYTSR